MNEAYAKIGQRVKSFRKECGLSQDELAEGICSRQTISLLENGQHFPSVEFMQKIAARLAIPLAEIMVDEVTELELKVQLDLIKIYVEIGDYTSAYGLAEELEKCEELLEYQMRELILYKADCLMRTGKATEAVEILMSLQHKLEKQRVTDDHLLATVYDKLGTSYYFLSNLTNAHANYMRAYQLTLLFPEFDLTAARITYNLGMAYRQLNRHTDAIEYLSKSEQFFKDVSDFKRLAQASLELGIAFRFRKEFERAEEYLKQSLSMYQSLNILNMARQVRQTHAFIVLSETRPEQSIQELLNCAIEYEASGDLIRTVNTYACIAHVLISNGNYSDSEQYLNKALLWLPAYEEIRDYRQAYVYQVNAEYLLAVDKLKECIEYSSKTFALFNEMGFERDSIEALKLSVDAYRKLGNLEEVDRLSQKIIEMLTFSQERHPSKLEAF